MTAPVLYVRDGSRFVPVSDAPPTWLVDVPPIPVPVQVLDDPAGLRDGDVAWASDDGQQVRLHRPRCPHGHFARWAARNCRPCAREESRRAR